MGQYYLTGIAGRGRPAGEKVLALIAVTGGRAKTCSPGWRSRVSAVRTAGDVLRSTCGPPIDCDGLAWFEMVTFAEMISALKLVSVIKSKMTDM